MNFFEQQQRSRTNTTRLVVLFCLAVFFLIVLTNFLFIIIISLFENSEIWTNPNATFLSKLGAIISQFNPILFCEISLGIIIFVTLVGLYKKSELSHGGKVIAQKLNGRLILPTTKDALERQLLNVVEEIAIASGTPVPPVYLINEDGINAFAAGYNSHDAVIGITKGALKNLNRDELQGVIAHEFSHIFNGDMRMNIRLIAILHGILVIGLIGSRMLNSIPRRSFSKDGDKILAIYLLLALGLTAIGFIGTFFGNLIKAGISRQKEYLADASAVQFTRNPNGIAGALKKIGAISSKISNSKSLEISHLFFAESRKSFFLLMSDHPPLEYRIRLIEPNWNGDFSVPSSDQEFFSQIEKTKNASNTNNIEKSFASIAGASFISTSEMIQNINDAGTIKDKSIDKAHELIVAIPEVIKNSIHDTYGAVATIYALLIKKDDMFYSKQLEILQNSSDANVVALTTKMNDEIEKLPQEMYLPIIEMALPTLKQLSAHQYQVFKKNILGLVNCDSKINIFEWSFSKILFNNLDPEFDKNDVKPKPIYSLKNIKDEVGLFLSLMANSGNKEDEAKEAFNTAIADQKLELNFLTKKEISINSLNKAAFKIERLQPLDKEKLLKTCVTCIAHDGKILPSEVQILRAFASIVQCPMPLIA